MNKLVAIQFGNQPVINSVEVSELMNKPHSDLMKSIRQYGEYLAEGHFTLGDFFIESSYQDKNNQSRPCFMVTRKGCEMIANKTTGQKGVLFTAAYINAFHNMENALSKKKSLPKTYAQALRLYADEVEKNEELQIELDSSKEWHSIKRVSILNHVHWTKLNWRKLKDASLAIGKPPRKIWDANFQEVNVYHMDAWELAYPQYEL